MSGEESGTEASRVDEYREALDADEAERSAKRAAVGKRFDPKVVLADANAVHVLVDPVLGEVKYGKLSKREFDELQTSKDGEVERAYKMVFLMLRKGYPGLTREEFEQMPFEVIARLSEAFAAKLTGFLQSKPKKSVSG